MKLPEEAPTVETESIRVIFDNDVDIGVGCTRRLASKWVAICQIPWWIQENTIS